MAIEIDDKATRKLLKRIERGGARTMTVAAFAGVHFLTRWVVTNKLLGQSLNRVTGTAIRSITASPRAEQLGDRGGRGVFGSNLDYVRAHNDGFQGEVPVRAHTRKVVRTTSRSTGKRLKRAKATGGTATVRAHTRTVNMRRRAFFNETMVEGRPGVNLRARKAVLILLRTGVVPKRADLERALG